MTDAVADAGEPCPSCGTARAGRFCEACGYDFVNRPAVVSRPAVGGWVAVVTADRDYFASVIAAGGPDASAMRFPEYCPQRRFPLTGQRVHIGRRSATRGIAPDIDLSGPPEDPGVSHLHAVLIAQSDSGLADSGLADSGLADGGLAGGGWAILDVGSTNGTTINDDVPVPANKPVPLASGDRIHVGAWTTITVQTA